MPMNELQANAAALMAAMANPQAARILPVIDGQAEHARELVAEQSRLWNGATPNSYDGPRSIKDLTTPDAVSFTIKAPPMRPVLRMYNASGQYGSLRFDENGVFQFEGDASASAQVLLAEMKRLSGK